MTKPSNTTGTRSGEDYGAGVPRQAVVTATEAGRRLQAAAEYSRFVTEKEGGSYSRQRVSTLLEAAFLTGCQFGAMNPTDDEREEAGQ